MSKADRSLWTEPRDPSTFAEALTTDLPRTVHECTPLVHAFEQNLKLPPHVIADCPGPVTLAIVARAAFGEEPVT